MTTSEYLQKVLENQTISNDSNELEALRSEREKVEDILRKAFKDSDPTIKYGGSKSKGTMIKERYDLDIICYFGSDDTNPGKTLKEIFENVKAALENEYSVNPKKTALRLECKDTGAGKKYTHIDVIPGRYSDETNGDAYLHLNNGDKDYMKTNPIKHVEHIRDSKLQSLIKLVKYWKERNGLQIKTFVLELLVVKILRGCNPDELEKCLVNFWTELKDNIEELSIEDPANPNGNDLSSMFDSAIKHSLTSAASRTIEFVDNNNWTSIFGELKESENNALKISIIEGVRERINVPSKPWVDI